MLERKELNGKTGNELQSFLESDVTVFADSISEFTIEQCKESEKELMSKQDEYNEYLKTVSYELPEDAEFDGVKYSKSKIQDIIVSVLNKNSVEWSYTLGLYQLVKLWKDSNLNHLTYGEYDSTLRLLGQGKYQGMREWADIMAVNGFLTNCHDEYALDVSYTIYLSQLHNVIMERMKILEAPETDTATETK